MISEQVKKLYTKAINRLSRKDYSVFQMRNALLKIEENDKLVDEVIELLKQKNLLNDQRLINEVISQDRQKGYGYFRIQQNLVKMGFESILIESALNEISSLKMDDMREQLRSILNSKFTGSKASVLRKIQEKLIRKGFSMNDVFGVVTNDIIDYDELNSCQRDLAKLSQRWTEQAIVVKKLKAKGYRPETIRYVLEKSV